MITASHNPGQYNGFKIIDPRVEQVYYGRGLEVLERALADADPRPAGARGRVIIDDILGEYRDHLAARFCAESLGSLSVVLDCANGVGGLPLAVLERLGVRHTLLHLFG